MSLGTVSFFHNYGPAAAAVDNPSAPIETELSIKGYGRLNEEVQVSLPTPNLKATRLRNRPVEATGEGELVQALPKGRATPTLSVSIGAIPSAFDIAQAVWLQNVSAVNVTGSTGEKLNSAGAGGDPWATSIPGSYTAGQAGFVLDAVKTQADSLPAANDVATAILDLANGVEASVTVREALRVVLAALSGKVSGAGTGTITIRDINDTTDRIVATVDTNGNRTAVTVDGS